MLVDADTSKKRNLLLVGGHADNPVEVCGEGNANAKRPCLGKGQTMLTKPPNQAEFEECEEIIKNGLSPSLVDDPLFRKALVTTARMGQSVVCMGKGTALGKRDTTLPRRDTFSRKIIPATDKRLDEGDMVRLKPRMELDKYYSKPIKGLDEAMCKKIHNVFMSRWSVFHAPIHSDSFAMDKQFCRRQMVHGAKTDIWSVMEG